MNLNATNKELKERALTHLNKNWLKAAVATLIAYVILGVPSTYIDIKTDSQIGSLLSCLLLPLTYGYYILFLRLKREDKIEFDTLFEGFKEYFPVLFTLLIMYIFTFLWSLLLIIPGIMKSYSYSMTCFLMADNPDLRYDAAIERSKKIMHGHRMQLFLLDLSMIGWFILSILSLGIGFFFLAPYIQTAHAEFYEELLKEEADGVDNSRF